MDTPFSVIMQQAAALKSEEMATLRRKFDSWPVWYRNTFYVDEEFIEARKITSFERRISMAANFKEQGNLMFMSSNFLDATNQYEHALGLFSWVSSLDPDWKKKGIEDKSLSEELFSTDNSEELKTISEFRLSCLLNLSSAYGKVGAWEDAIRACDAALDMDPLSAKAYYRRAQARIIPPSCSIVENEFALRDLKKALEILPNDIMIRNSYSELKNALNAFKSTSKKTLKKAFEVEPNAKISKQGTIKTNDSIIGTINNKNNVTLVVSQTVTNGTDEQHREGDSKYRRLKEYKQVEMTLRQMEEAAENLEKIGELESAAEIRGDLEAISKELDIQFTLFISKKRSRIWKALENTDFLHPSAEMVEDGKKCGLDLNQEKDRSIMSDLHKEIWKNPDNKIESYKRQISDSSVLTNNDSAFIDECLNYAAIRMRRRSNHNVATQVVDSFPNDVHRSMIIYRRGADLYPERTWGQGYNDIDLQPNTTGTKTTKDSNKHKYSSKDGFGTSSSTVPIDLKLRPEVAAEFADEDLDDDKSNSGDSNDSDNYGDGSDDEYSEEKLLAKAQYISSIPAKDITAMLIESITDDLVELEGTNFGRLLKKENTISNHDTNNNKHPKDENIKSNKADLTSNYDDDDSDSIAPGSRLPFSATQSPLAEEEEEEQTSSKFVQKFSSIFEDKGVNSSESFPDNSTPEGKSFIENAIYDMVAVKYVDANIERQIAEAKERSKHKDNRYFGGVLSTLTTIMFVVAILIYLPMYLAPNDFMAKYMSMMSPAVRRQMNFDKPPVSTTPPPPIYIPATTASPSSSSRQSSSSLPNYIAFPLRKNKKTSDQQDEL